MRQLSRYIETDRSFYKSLLIMALPLAAQNLITMGANLVDNMMLGALGETAMSSATLANHYISLFQYAMMGIAMGSSVLTVRFWGAGDLKALRKTVTIALRFALAMSASLTAVTALLAPRIMALYTAESDVVQRGAAYLIWSLPTLKKSS